MILFRKALLTKSSKGKSEIHKFYRSPGHRVRLSFWRQIIIKKSPNLVLDWDFALL
jgi:hypothetical protein